MACPHTQRSTQKQSKHDALHYPFLPVDKCHPPASVTSEQQSYAAQGSIRMKIHDHYFAKLCIFVHMVLSNIMKLLFIFIFSAFLFLSLCPETANAQSAPPKQNIDTDIRALRNEAMPSFRWHYDDYLQYAPAGVLIGLKAGGYESRSSWGRMLVSDAFSAAIMAAAVNGIKYSVKRMRPDGSTRNSFPSGHTATAFMTATMLHKEYEWRSPWISIAGYTAATVTGVSRIFNNRHWISDVMAGAAIGIGSVHLGYFITDKIFKDRHISKNFADLEYLYDPSQKHYVAEIMFGRRYILGKHAEKQNGILPYRGGLAGIQTDIPIIPGTGVTARASASSMTYSGENASNLYALSAGGFWNLHFAKVFEIQLRAAAGCGWFSGHAGADLSAGAGLSLITDNNFKVKAFADFESICFSRSRWLSSVTVGWAAAWFW